MEDNTDEDMMTLDCNPGIEIEEDNNSTINTTDKITTTTTTMNLTIEKDTTIDLEDNNTGTMMVVLAQSCTEIDLTEMKGIINGETVLKIIEVQTKIEWVEDL